MATQVTLDTRRYAPWVKKLIKRYRIGMNLAIAISIDNIRARAARSFIIPNKTGTRNPYEATKKQPSDSTRLTSRTGKLVEMLEQDATPGGTAWSIVGTKTMRLNTSAFDGMVKVAAGFGTANEEYVGTLRVHVKPGDITSDWVARAYLRGKVRGEANPAALLAMRFKHETGIRGSRRPFMAPAVGQEEFPFRKLVDQKLNELGYIR